MRALIMSAGALRGAYGAGVATALLRKLGHKHFNAVYMSSVGSMTGTFFAANQPDTIEDTWRNRVHGRQLINYFNIFRRKNILNTEYLIELFDGGKSKLDIAELFSSGIKLTYVVENLKNESVEYLKPTPNNIFTIIRAATAVPVVHSPVTLNGQTYIDGTFVEPLPVRQALEDGYTDIVLIYNKSEHFHEGWFYQFIYRLLSALTPPKLRRRLQIEARETKIEEYISKSHNIKVIRPMTAVPFSVFNTNKKVINKLFDLGLADGYRAAESMSQN